ncbi:MAG: hypothetical protein L0Z50_39760, partial [Verrucomicrobiales bacterium]|nr:hypothetical protein [Verrucomicrobiales bacterium]
RNTNAKTEEALAGVLVDADGNPLVNQADPSAVGNARADGKKLGTADNALVQFEIETVVNWDQGGGSNGAFTPDEQMPGIPGIDGGADGIAGEILTYLDLPKGLITMGVNSDDGFKTTAGLNPSDAASALLLGEFSGGRGAADTIFQFVVEEAGIYALRTTWEEGGGGANIEWFTINGGTKVLVNDDANGGVKAYRTATVQLPAALIAQVPAKGASGIDRKPASISATWKDPGGVIAQNSIKMKVDGQDVTPTVTKTGENLTAAFTPTAEFGFDQDVKVDLTYTNAGRDASASWTFSTVIDLAKAGTLFIETEDFDFDAGNYIKNAAIGIPAGKYAGGAYQDLGDGVANEAGNKSFDVDYHESNAGTAQAIYRPQTGVEAGKSGDTAGIGFARGSFDVEVNHVVGWNDAGDWYNYTRDWPTPEKTYKAWVRSSSGGAAIHLELAQITAGVGTKDQTKKKLGEFDPGRATAGWDGVGAFEIFPLVNDDGSRATFTLGGKSTLRLTTIDGNNDTDFLIFQETTAAPPTGGKFTSIKVTAGKVVIEFTGAGLQSADAVTGPWSDVTGASSPYSADPTGTAKYFRFRP